MNFSEMKEIAQLFAASKLFPDVASMAAAFVKIKAGQELGFGEFQSMSAFDIIKGKVQLNANGQAIKVKASGRYDYQVLELSDTACELEFFEKDPVIPGGPRRSLGKSRFTIQDAQRAKLAGSDNYGKYPRNMLFSRAMTNGVAWYCPDAVGMRVYGEGELEESARECEGSPELSVRAATPTVSAPPLPATAIEAPSAPVEPSEPAKVASESTSQGWKQTLASNLAKNAKPTLTIAGKAVEAVEVDEKAEYDAIVARHEAELRAEYPSVPPREQWVATHDQDGQPLHPLDRDEQPPDDEDRVLRIMAAIGKKARKLVPKGSGISPAGMASDLLHTCFGVELDSRKVDLVREALSKLDEHRLADGELKLEEA